jgi:hypothetical protein
MWDKDLDELGEKVCALYPFICELCYEVGHFNFQCSGHNNGLSNPMSTASLYCDDKITPNQYDELTLFLGCEELPRKTSLVDMSAFNNRDFYFRALRFLVVLSFPQLLSFPSVFPKPLSETLTRSSEGRNPVQLTVLC